MFLFGIANLWERHIILRFGHLHRVVGPGFYFLIPFVDRPIKVDKRIITYTIPLQRGLTRDNIPVDVDAVVFYQVEDEVEAVVGVDDHHRATQLCTRTAVRDMVGKANLDDLLSERDKIGAMVRDHAAGFAQRWGVKIIAVEIRNVVVSKELEDAIAREPAAEREKRARIKLAEAEKLTAQTIVDAAAIYEDRPIALALRSMNMLYEMCMEGSSTMIFVPTERTGAGMPGVIGMESIQELLDRTARGKAKADQPDEDGSS